MTEHDLEDVIVTIEHPFGTLEVPLTTWIRRGPGPRTLLRPTAASSRLTGEALPLDVIPFRYRNDSASRRAIAAGEIEDPWPEV
ncbi:hypothetical protein AB0E69_31600 [Kribbella sp. NPDC026611]|uniref:hypothetical protein n=1 Tax=Kribbella sp. NPDC026611 TaxID=3154911 RepID=UPI0033E144EF